MSLRDHRTRWQQLPFQPSPQHHPHLVRSLRHQRDLRSFAFRDRQRRAVELGGGDSGHGSPRVLDGDRVFGRVVAEGDLVDGPGFRNGGVDHEPGAVEADAQDGFDAGAVHPPGGAGVPGPAAPSGVGGLGVDVARDDVGLHFVALDSRPRLGVIDRIDDRKQLGGLVAVSQLGEGQDAPHRGVRVLTAVLAHAGQIPLDIARIERRAIERRRE